MRILPIILWILSIYLVTTRTNDLITENLKESYINFINNNNNNDNNKEDARLPYDKKEFIHIENKNSFNKNYLRIKSNNKDFKITGANESNNNNQIRKKSPRNFLDAPSNIRKEIRDAFNYGKNSLEELITIKEPYLYNLGFFLKQNNPAAKVAKFGAPKDPKALLISRNGFATLEASRKIAETFHESVGRQHPGISLDVEEKNINLEDCPFKRVPKCLSTSSKRFRTADGTCNNLEHILRGSALMPMQRFLPPVYEDGIQSIRRSVFGRNLPSARKISTLIHTDQHREIHSVTLMFMQWGQFIDHDLTSTVKSRSFNGSIPQCCNNNGQILPPEFLHPSCLPIEIPANDPFFNRFKLECMEFTRSAPSTTVDCKLSWREQINQVSSYLDGSALYGSDLETTDSMRTFRDGKIFYGIPGSGVGEDLCKSGILVEDCLQPGDRRFSENPGLIAMHLMFARYHNKIAKVLSKINLHWNDERVFQETRKIIYSAIQQITFREYLPVLLGPDVMDLFELRLLKSGYFNKYDPKINPTISNSFSTAAFRFGHSMVQNSFIRTDHQHFPIFNNISLHNEPLNQENIWSRGSIDRLLLGFLNQPSQKRDEFIADELTNHLFQSNDESFPFGMDLAAINIQRGRDHGIPPYTFWREPCGLSPIKSWQDLEQILSSPQSILRLRSLYSHVDDLDLFTAGLAEKPLRGAILGPTFACIIAQQFSNLRKGDRFWFENSFAESASFSATQLEQIRKISLAQIICQTMNEVETVQSFAFLSADDFRNLRISCNSAEIRNFDLAPWIETSFELNSLTATNNDDEFSDRAFLTKKTQRLGRIKRDNNNKTNFTSSIKIKTRTDGTTEHTKMKTKIEPKYTGKLQNYENTDITYLIGMVPSERVTKPATLPVQLNINIHIQQQTQLSSTTTTEKIVKKITRPSITNDIYNQNEYNNFVAITQRPKRPSSTTTTNFPTIFYQPAFDTPIYQNSFTNNKPTTLFANNMEYATANGLKRPNNNGIFYTNTNKQRPLHQQHTDNLFYSSDSTVINNNNFDNKNQKPTYRPTIIYQNVPFSTSNNKQTYYNNFNNNNNDDDDDDDISNMFFNKYSEENIEDIKPAVFNNNNYGIIDDKLDFGTNRKHDQSENNDAYIQLSSAKKVEYFRNYLANPEVRNGKSLLFDRKLSINKPASSLHQEDKIEIQLPTEIPCSYELPKPMIEFLPSIDDDGIRSR